MQRENGHINTWPNWTFLSYKLLQEQTITYEQNIMFTQAHKQCTTTKNYTKGE